VCDQFRASVVGDRREAAASATSRLVDQDCKRDFALFNLTIDGKLGGCDVVVVRVDYLAPSEHALDRAIMRQRKTGRSVRFELTDQRGRRSTITFGQALESPTSCCSLTGLTLRAASPDDSMPGWSENGLPVAAQSEQVKLGTHPSRLMPSPAYCSNLSAVQLLLSYSTYWP
jgi:hypothetical protein